ncbi:MAG TPA: hypothetical protein VN223_04465 [Candidatus Elarobacter sp.]|nr:hypothetical protein [Candidatus Elarobacter sp.]
MREIDPQFDAPLEDDHLTGALRRLAASSRQGAPAEIGAGLTMAFRRHHARRRLVRRMSVFALAACIALVTGLVSMRPAHQTPKKEQPHEVAAGVPDKTANTVRGTTVAVMPVHPAVRPARPKASAIRASSRNEFLALPGYDPAVPADELHVVRVQLPASALWQIGAPVSPDSGARKFMADFVVSQDGTPYAVRLVQ